jgi:hypothetical protein
MTAPKARAASALAALALCLAAGDSSRGVLASTGGAPPVIPPFGPPPQVVNDYVLHSTHRLSRTQFEHTYGAHLSNWGDGDVNVSASLLSASANVTVVDGELDFGLVPQGDTVESADTFTIRHERIAPLRERDLLWGGQVVPAELTTYELIDRAGAEGEIDGETVLAYKVFADFADERLPAQFRGRDDRVVDGRAIEVAARHFAALSQPSQDLLAPFLMRPDDPGSWVEVQAANEAPAAVLPQSAAASAALPPIAWSRKPVVINGVTKAWIWWMRDRRPDDQYVVDALKLEMESYLWEKLTAAFKEPAPDDVIGNGAPGSNPKPHGPDGLLDIYLTSLQSRSITRPVTDICDGSPLGAYILLSQFGTLATVAHELMHAIVASYPLADCIDSYHWMNEATATWAEHFTYNGRLLLKDTEHQYAPDFLRKPREKPLDPASVGSPDDCRTLNPADPDTGEALNLDEELCGEHQYGAYLWFLSLTDGSTTDASRVRFTWSVANTLSAIEAIDTVNGGFSENWPKFLANNWNRLRSAGGPHRAYFTWDGLDDTKAYEQGGGSNVANLPLYWIATEPVFHQLPPLAAQYNHYDFTAEPRIRQVWYFNDYAGSDSRADVRAIVKVQGQWSEATDWSPDRKRVFCRDDPAQDIQELVLIVSNLDLAGAETPATASKLGGPGTKLSSPLRLVYSPIPCHDWVGSVSFHTVNSSANGNSITTTANAGNVRFRFDPVLSDPIPTSGFTYFDAVQGSVDWHVEHVVSECSGAQFTGSFLPAGKLRMAPTGTRLSYGFVNESPGSSDQDTMTCPGGPLEMEETFSQWLPNPFFYDAVHGPLIEDRQEYGNSPGDGWIWRFSKP